MGDAEKALDLHIELLESDPHMWRDLRVPAGIGLPDLHRAIKLSFGWEDSQAHLFSLAGAFAGRRILAGDEETALAMGTDLAADFTLADALHGKKSTLRYEYGGGWTHEITVTGHAVMPAGYLGCLGGASRGPAEAPGGPGVPPGGYALSVEPDDGAAGRWVEEGAGGPVPDSGPAGFDRDRVNLRLARLSAQLTGARACPDEQAEIVRPVKWLLERAGTDGLELTKDGYLKPAVVREAAEALGWADRLYGKANREVRTRPVFQLRTRLQDWGLLRRFKGRLVLTPAGRALAGAGDEGRLWDYLADRLAHPGSDPASFLNGLFAHWLLAGTLPAWQRRGQVLTEALHTAGYRLPSGRPVTEDVGADLVQELEWTFRVLNIFLPGRDLLQAEEASVAGAKFLIDLRRRQDAGPEQSR
ncbi:plasmid pRiA4b ORF-3 family protein [Arthrobacter mobilis]|uniref:Plasmid pRiA4b ORF-3 family protein n=1 Tax=Arthrobacter mobilis TaxID=2724944 RepID=A0A7X6K301_9MICC|nr:plasmid pRiA4b ORF-3 family protein [Arthrobacter mobilis]NKX52990.1 plasmid pRiA4b ORF-3 family protein [Arthrobacter mobilis]